ncbi:hypothetical protein BJF90_11200 [Pseudonocardia sp. CNS-004]|nr:hypothetical protein BJF90_11200 [Pseudonocardia sp. CNS-004]
MQPGGIEVRHAGGSVRVPPGRPFVIGRGPDAELEDGVPARDLWEHASGPWLLAVGVLAAQLVVMLGVAAWLLRRQDPVRR